MTMLSTRRLFLLLAPATLLVAAPLHAFQLDPGWRAYSLYELTFSDGLIDVTAATLSATTAFGGYLGGKEHWSLPASFVSAIQGASPGSSLRIDGSAGPQYQPSGAVPGFPVAGALRQFTMPAQLSAWSWTAMSSAPPTAFYASTSHTNNVGVAFDLTPPVGTTDPWTGSITWYVLSDTPPGGYPVVAGSDTTFIKRAAPAAARGHGWYSVTLTPTTP